MRRLVKLDEPDVLVANKDAWRAEYEADLTNKTKRYRYRHDDIKETLLRETGGKCIYCESKVGHNTPGDVEHKTPSSANRALHFIWANLTIACTECNRRKSAYFDQAVPFLDPYSDDVDSRVIHLGPIVSWLPGDAAAEVTIKILEMHDCSRDSLINRKVETIDKLNNLLARIKSEGGVMREMLMISLEKLKAPNTEFSAMIASICQQCRIA